MPCLKLLPSRIFDLIYFYGTFGNQIWDENLEAVECEGGTWLMFLYIVDNFWKFNVGFGLIKRHIFLCLNTVANATILIIFNTVLTLWERRAHICPMI